MNSSPIKSGVILLALSATVVPASQEPAIPTIQDAQKELFADRFDSAARLFSLILRGNPGEADAYVGLVSALIEAHRPKEAFVAADNALQRAPNTAGALTASGMAAYRRGEIAKAVEYFQSALKLNSQYPEALKEMALIYRTVSKYKTARGISMEAYRLAPDDPGLMLVYANSLRGAEHVAALERALAALDPQSERAEGLRRHIASDRTLGDRKVRQLVSPYRNSDVKLFRIMGSAGKLRGFGLHVQLNQRETVRLLLDTGAGGIAVSPKVAEKAGLARLAEESTKTKGIGDEKAPAASGYFASEIRVGDVVFANYPVEVFKSAQTPDFDGLIGANVFRRFIVGMDFVHGELSLQARTNDAGVAPDEPEDAGDRPEPGFFRVFRFGDHLALPTLVNDEKQSRLFLIDSGASMSLIDTTSARESTGVFNDGRTSVRGVQGKVAQTLRASRVTLAFAGFRQENDGLISIDLEKMSESFGAAFGGVLGLPILSQMKLTVDYHEGTAKLDYQK